MNQTLPNPFAAPPPKAPPSPEVERWGIAASGPAVDPTEVETSAQALEVVILWGDESVLHVAHLSPPRDVVIGEAGIEGVEYLIGADAIGTSRLPVVVERNGKTCCVIPEGATGEVTIGEIRKSFAELREQGHLQVFGELEGASLYVMPDEATARVAHRDFTFLVRPVHAGKKIGPATNVRWRSHGWIGLSIGVHALFLVMFYFLPPSSSALSLDAITEPGRLVEYMADAPEVMEDPMPEWTQPSEQQAGGQGERAAGDTGEAGREDSPRTRNRQAVERVDNSDPRLARERAMENARNVATIGTIRQALGAWNQPTSPFGAATANGMDITSALGALQGDQVGDNFGFFGLGMTGTGRGAGGTGEGTYGLGRLGTMGQGGCMSPPCGNGPGYGGSVGGLRRGITEHEPRVRLRDATVNGSLSQEAIRRVVQRHVAEVRFCYQQGLQSRPDLEGRVVVSWIISPSGAVQSSSLNPTSNLGDARVEQCVVQAVRRWTFPSPDGGGMVGVNYPFVLQPAD